MDKSRRGLSTALVVTEEMKEFVSPSKNTPKRKLTEVPPSPSTRTKTNVANSDSSVSIVEKLPTPPKTTLPSKPTNKQSLASPKPNMLSQPLVAITTRFQPATADNLRRASLERKLAGKSPWSQQEIIEQAVLDWLAK